MIQITLGIAVTMSAMLAALNLLKPRVTQADWWMFGWLCANAIAMIMFLAAYQLSGIPAVIASTLANTFIACCAPALYLYVITVAGQNPRHAGVHFLLPVANVLVICAIALTGGLGWDQGAIVVHADLPIVAASLLLQGIWLAYCWTAIRAIDRHLRKARRLGAHWVDVRDLRWVRRWALGSLVGLSVCTAIFLLGVFQIVPTGLHVAAVLAVQTFLIIFVGYSGLSGTRFFRPGSGQPAPLFQVSTNINAAAWAGIDRQLRDSRIWEQPKVILAEAARAIGLSSDVLENALAVANQGSVTEVLNRYRIDAVKAALCDRTKKSQSVLSIAYDAGFGSKSAFYAAFQASEDIAPTQYRKICLTKASD